MHPSVLKAIDIVDTTALLLEFDDDVNGSIVSGFRLMYDDL